MGTRREMNNPKMLQWLKTPCESAELVLSVCSGALVLAKAGLLNGLKATTHHDALDELAGNTSGQSELMAKDDLLITGA